MPTSSASATWCVPFKCLSRADLLLRDGEVDALRDAGCETVWIGAESGSQRILDAMEKGTRVEQIEEAARRLRQAGIRSGFFLQFGYPGEGPDEIDATRRLVQRVRRPTTSASPSRTRCPARRFYERVRAELGEQRNWVDSEDLSMLYEGPFSTEYYRWLHRVVHKEFRLQKAAGTRSPATAPRPGRRPRRLPRPTGPGPRRPDPPASTSGSSGGSNGPSNGAPKGVGGRP